MNSMNHYIDEIDRHIVSLRNQLEEDRNAAKEFNKKVDTLMSGVSDKAKSERLERSFPSSKSFLDNKIMCKTSQDSLLKDESYNLFFLQNNDEIKRKQLAQERNAEYNAFLKKKEENSIQHKRVLEEKRNVTAKSVLEFVDYDKVLSQRKEEELNFRQINCASPKLEKSLPTSVTDVKENVDISSDPTNSASSVELSCGLLPSRTPMGSSNSQSFSRSKEVMVADNSSGNLSFIRSDSRKTNHLYRQELLKQIEEKKRLELLEQEKARLLEEECQRRLEEQQIRMQREYEEEHKRTEERKMKRLQVAEELRRRETEKSQNSRPAEHPIEVPSEKVTPSTDASRAPSPPVPAVRTRTVLEKNRLASLGEVKPQNALGSFADIRRSILQEREKLKRDWTGSSYEVTDRRTVGGANLLLES